MTWIKRNLILLVGGLVFVLAVLGSMLMLKNQMAERERVGSELESQIQELERLTSRANFPDPSNVKDMESDNEQLQSRIDQLLKQFAGHRLAQNYANRAGDGPRLGHDPARRRSDVVAARCRHAVHIDHQWAIFCQFA